MEPSLYAGVARRAITPAKGIFLIGYGERTRGNIGVHDDLTATALFLGDGATRVAIVALDLLTINEFIVDRIRARLAPVEAVLCCSHTHSAPIAFADEKSPRKDREYIDTLIHQIVSAVRAAEADAFPAHLEYSSAEAFVGINRREKSPDGRMTIGRNPGGARDRSLQVMSILTDAGRRKGDRAGTRLATVVNYACHGTVLGPDNLLVSADWIGGMRARVEAELGGLVLFLQGAAANINPAMYWNEARAFEMVVEQGSSVAEAVLAAAGSQSKRISTVPIRVTRAEAWLPTEARAVTPRPPKNYGKGLLSLARLPSFMVIFVDRLLDRRYPWKPVIEAKDGFWSVPMRVNALRIGDLALVTLAAETFTEIGLKVKSASPAAHTLFASVTDGCISYLHTAEAHLEGGYEVDVAPLAYRYPGRLQARCEAIALHAVQQLLNKLWS